MVFFPQTGETYYSYESINNINNIVGINSNVTKWAFYAGETNNEYGSINSNAKFRVGHDGSLWATNAILSGGCKIGSWSIITDSKNSEEFAMKWRVRDGGGQRGKDMVVELQHGGINVKFTDYDEEVAIATPGERYISWYDLVAKLS